MDVPTNFGRQVPPSALPAIYAEAGANYRAIDDLRLRLLGLLPLATGTGIVLLLRPEGAPSGTTAIPAGIFGILATISLFFYELHGIEKCAHFIHRSQELERTVHVPGSFTARPRAIFSVASEHLPAEIIYPASLAGWVFVTLSSLTGSTAGAWAAATATVMTLVVGILAAVQATRVLETSRKRAWKDECNLLAAGGWPED
jgi:hypothetical protein